MMRYLPFLCYNLKKYYFVFKKSQTLFLVGVVLMVELSFLAFFIEPTDYKYLYLALLLVIGTSLNVWLFYRFLYKRQVSTPAESYWNNEEERIRTSLAIAEKIQKHLLPELRSPVNGLDIYAKCRPSDEIGGDFYQIIPLAAHQTLISMGDVAGHGLPSAMVSIIVDTLLYAFMDESDLLSMVAKMNAILYQRIDPTLFSTLLLLKWDEKKQMMLGAGAGFGRFLHYQSHSNHIAVIKGGGIALGMVADSAKQIAHHQFSLLSGDVLVLYTDGIPEMRNPLGERLGVDRLQTMVMKHCSLTSSEEIFEAVSQDILNFAGTAKLIDDVTLMIIRRVC